MIGTGKQHSKWICWLTCTFLLLTGMVVSAVAGPVQVWVQPSGDTFAKAYVITGESRTYFGRVEGGGGSYEYKWEFSDGVATAFAAVVDPRYISYDKIFASAGTQWAKLTVRDAGDTSNSASAQINLQVIAAASDNLSRQKNSAIDRGLRYTYMQEDVGCAAGSTGYKYFENYGAGSSYIYGWTEGLNATLYYIYSYYPTVWPGTFTIDWGDGTPVETYPGLSYDPSYAYLEYIYHTYATAGTYTISVSHDGAAANPFVSVDAIATGATTSSQSCWPGSGFPFGSTGMALIAFENHGHNLQAPDSDIFKKSVQNGIQFILNNAVQQTLDDQPYIGDPKANGSDTINDHLGVYFGSTDLYEASIAYMALVNSADEAFSKTALASTGNAINGLSFWDIAVDAADWLAWAQNDDGGRGGWRYGPNYGSSDGSVTQWPVLALSEAKNRWNIHVNPLVIDELNIWLDYIQAADGSFGYESPGSWNNFPKTAAGLIQFKYAGRNHSDAPVLNAESYVDAHWTDVDVTAGNWMYSMYAFYKAMKIWGITNFYGRAWEEMYDQSLVVFQAADNTWGDNDGWEDRNFATYSALAILAPEVASLPPVANAGGPYPSINPGQVLALDGSHSYHQDPAKSIVTWQWDFDASNGLWWDVKAAPDAGEGATGLAPSVSYPDLGHDQNYTVTLRVIDNTAPEALTDTDTAAISVTTGNVAPVPVTNGPWSGLPGVPILFDGSASYDPNACTTAGDPACLGDSIVSYEWDLDGDGLYNEANGDDGAPVVAGNYSQVTKSFSTPVSLSARLRVTDEFGLTATSSDSLNVVSIAIVFGQQYNICYRVAINRYEDRLGIQVKFKNEGNAPAENLVMELKNTPSNMTILKSTSDLGDLGAGAEAFTACDPTAKVADIELRTNRLIKPTGGWIWRATFQFNGQSYTVDGIPPLAP